MAKSFKTLFSGLFAQSSQNEEKQKGRGFVPDLGQSYRVQMWTSRVLLVACVGLVFTNIFTALCLSALLPLKEIQPMFITTSDKPEQIVKIEPYEVGTTGNKLLTEKMARKYLIKRESVDLQTDKKRYEEVQMLSDDSVYRNFENFVKREESFLKKAQKDILTRSIDVNSISWLSNNQLYIEYEAIDKHFDEIIDQRSRIAVMTFEYRPYKVRHEDRYLNPIGWTVTNYTITEKSRSDKSRNDKPRNDKSQRDSLGERRQVDSGYEEIYRNQE